MNTLYFIPPPYPVTGTELTMANNIVIRHEVENWQFLRKTIFLCFLRKTIFSFFLHEVENWQFLSTYILPLSFFLAKCKAMKAGLCH